MHLSFWYNLIVFSSILIILVSGEELNYNKHEPLMIMKFRNGLFKLSQPLAIASAINVNVTEECRRDSQIFIDDLQYLELWALEMYDATGKFPSGLLNGNVHMTGDMKMCLETIAKKHQIYGKFCLATIFFEAIVDDANFVEIVDRVKSYQAFRSTYEDETISFPHTSEITWGFCLPSSCTHQDLENYLRHIIEPYNHTTGLEIKLRVNSGHCKTNESLSLTFQTAIFFVFIAIVVIVTIVGGVYDFIYNYETRDIKNEQLFIQILYAFSPRRNWKLLIQDDQLEDDIRCVHGLRFIFSLILYFVHKMSFKYYLPMTNRTENIKRSMGTLTMIVRAFINHVDTFVIMSGLLTSYFAVKKLKQGHKLNVLSMYFQRYVKFAPIYFIVLNMSHRYMLPSTPTALRLSAKLNTVCQHNWWARILFIENFLGANNMCYISAHQLFVDFQLYLTAPFIIMTLWKYSKHAYKILFGLIMIFTVIKAFEAYYHNHYLLLIFGLPINQLSESTDILYLNPIQRIIPYLFGIGLGYYFQMNKKPMLGKSDEIIGWTIATLSAYYSFFAMAEVTKKDTKYDPFEVALYTTLQPLTWSFTICWIIFACHLEQSERINKFLSWNRFMLFSKISYGFYILQLQTMFLFIMNSAVPKYNRPLLDMFDLNELLFLVFYSICSSIFVLFPTGHLYLIWRNRKSVKADVISNESNQDTKKDS